MILYNNGSSTTVAAEAVNVYSFADQDRHHQHLGHVPHPNNVAVAYGTVLANLLKMTLHLDANADRTNSDIIRTTLEWLDTRESMDMFMVIQWTDMNWEFDTIGEYREIVAFHKHLTELGIKHLFFNARGYLNIDEDLRYDFGTSFVEPYLPEGSYDGWLQANGYQPVITSNVHYGPGAHAAWARRLIQYINENKIL